MKLNDLFISCCERRYGPRQKRRMEVSEEGKINCDFKFAPFSSPGRRQIFEERSKELAMLVVQSLEVAVRLNSFPKSILDLYVTVLQDDGSIALFSFLFPFFNFYIINFANRIIQSLVVVFRRSRCSHHWVLHCCCSGRS